MIYVHPSVSRHSTAVAQLPIAVPRKSAGPCYSEPAGAGATHDRLAEGLVLAAQQDNAADSEGEVFAAADCRTVRRLKDRARW